MHSTKKLNCSDLKSSCQKKNKRGQPFQDSKAESLKNIEDKIAVRQKELKVKKDELESIIEKTEKKKTGLSKTAPNKERMLKQGC